MLRPADGRGQPDWGAQLLTLTTSDNGKTWTSGALKAGTYFIIETKAPTGHSLLPVPIGITLTDTGTGTLSAALANPDDQAIAGLAFDEAANVVTLTVENQVSGGTLPHTGDTGVAWYFALGVLLVLAGIVLSVQSGIPGEITALRKDTQSPLQRWRLSRAFPGFAWKGVSVVRAP